MGVSDDSSDMTALRDLRNRLSSTNYGLSIINEYENASALFLEKIELHSEKQVILRELAESSILPIVESAKRGESQQAIDHWRSLRSNIERKLGLLE